jgi:hypothetical protein
MERPAPFQPPAPRSPSGWSLSLGLHGLMLLAAFWYVTGRPSLPPLPPILPVELVTSMPAPIPVSRPGAAGPRASAPRPAIAPPQQSAAPTEDALTAQLQALSRLRAPDGPLVMGTGGGGAGTGSGGASLADFVRAQIMRRWIPVLTNRQRRDPPVLLRLTVTDKGELTDIVILDQQAFDGNLLFRSIAIGARNAAVLSSPIPMPPGAWPKATVLTIALNPRDASR